MSKPLILYHANCNDGFCAAWVAHRKFGDKADYIPVQYGKEPPAEAFDKDRPLYVLDFSYKGDVTFKLAALRHEAMVVLDHHKTAQQELAGLEIQLASNNCGDALTVIFDMVKSGGRLAWDYFFPGEPASWLVDYTEDRDLWRWDLPNSKEVNAALASLPRTFECWDENHKRFDGSPLSMSTWVEQGAAILRYQSQLVDSIAATAREHEIEGHKVLAANTSCLFSEVAEKLATDRPFGAAWFIRSDGKRQWSLRSRDGGVDVSEVARKRGGGGHRAAAGFEDNP